MSTKNRKKNKRKFITRGHGSEPTVIEFNLSKAVLLCITIGVIITTITTVKVITTIIGAKQDNVLADENATYTYVQSSDGIQVPVPKGYVASQIPGETSVNGGFVIYEDNYNGQSIDWNSILGTNSLSLNSLDASSQTSETTSSLTNGASADEITDTVLNESEEAEEINEEETELDQTTSNETISNDNKEDGTESADEQKETIETEGTSKTETADKTEDSEGTEITDNNENVDENTDNSDFVNDEKITEQEEEQTDETAEEQEEIQEQDNNNEQEELKDEEQINNREDNQEQEEQRETSQPVKVPNSANTVLANENSIQLYANSTQQDINIFNLQKSVNQYVWVPVSEENLSRIYGVDANGKLWGKLYKYSSTERTANNWTETSGVMSITSSTSYREPALVSGYDKDSTLQTDLGGMTAYEFLSELEENFYATIKSIKEHGGFYIGRYETGGLSGTAVVRKMETDINNQTWYTMYEKTKELSGTNDNAITSMIWGSLWDETLQWLIDSGAKTSDGTQLTYELIGSDSTKWGNYSNSTFSYIPADATTPDETATKPRKTLIPTGSAEYTKVNNIYDLAGNVYDWTLEAYSATNRVLRGGYYNIYGNYDPAADRISIFLPGRSSDNYGSRSALFIK